MSLPQFGGTSDSLTGGTVDGRTGRMLVHSMQDIIEFNERHRDKEMPYFGQDIMTRAQAKGPRTDKP